MVIISPPDSALPPLGGFGPFLDFGGGAAAACFGTPPLAGSEPVASACALELLLRCWLLGALLGRCDAPGAVITSVVC
eukprot:3361286-Pyramimonas_sp.AAC.1